MCQHMKKVTYRHLTNCHLEEKEGAQKLLYERNYLLGLTEDENKQYEEITGHKFHSKRV